MNDKSNNNNDIKVSQLFLVVTILQKELLLKSYEIGALLNKLRGCKNKFCFWAMQKVYVCTDGGKGVHWKANKNTQGRGDGGIIYYEKKYLMNDSHVKKFRLAAIECSWTRTHNHLIHKQTSSG